MLHLRIWIAQLLWFGAISAVYSQWTPIPTVISGPNDLYFTDAQTGYIVGNSGIYRTGDGGLNWQPAGFPDSSAEQAVYTRTRFKAVYFCPAICNKGYAAGQDTLLQQGVCFETADQGASWQLFQPVADPPASWNDLIIVNNTIFLAGDDGRLVVKHPFNPNWTEAGVPPQGDIAAVWFSGASPGGLATSPLGLFYSPDAGANWQLLNASPMADAIAGFSKGFAVGGSSIYRAIPPNSTSPWAEVFRLPDSVQVRRLAMPAFNIDNSAVGSNNGVYKRITDAVWEMQPGSQGYSVRALFFVNANSGYAICDNGVLLKTENAGGPTLPYVDFDFQTTGCVGDTVIFKHKGYSGNTYQWSVNDSIIAGATDSLVWHFDTAGVYQVSLTGANADYSNTYNRQIVITPYPDISTAVTPEQDTLCLGDEVVILIQNSQPEVRYTLIQTPGGIPVDSAAGSGGILELFGGSASAALQYAATAQNILSGCFARLEDTAYVAVVPPTTGMTLPPLTICPGDTAQLAAREGLAYQWAPADLVDNPGIAAPNAYPSDTVTLFTVSIQTPFCPAFSDSIWLNINFPPQPGVILSGDSLYASPVGATLYEWYHNDQPVPMISGSAMPLLGEGSYQVILTDSIGCRSAASPVIIVIMGTDQLEAKEMEVFPNPTDGRMTFINGIDTPIRQIQFFDALGRLRYTVEWPGGVKRHDIQIPAQVPRGLFFWKAACGTRVIQGRGILK